MLGSRLLRHADRVASICWLADGSALASGGWDGVVCVWDTATGSRQASWRGHVGPVHGVGVDDRTGAVLSCGEDGTVRKWSTHEGGLCFAVALDSGPLYAICVHEGVAYAAAADGAIQAIEVDRALVVPAVRRHKPAAGLEAMSLDHRFTLRRHPEAGLQIRETDAPDIVVATVGKDAQLQGDAGGASVVSFLGRRTAFRAWPRRVNALAVCPDRGVLYSCGEDGGVREWDLSGEGPGAWFAAEAGVINALCVDAARELLWTAGVDGRVRAYAGGVGVCVAPLSDSPLLAVAATTEVVLGGGEDTHIHAVRPGAAVPESSGDRTTWSGHFWHVTCLQAHASERLVASASKDYTIRIWSTQTASEVTPRIDAPDDYIDAVAWVAADGEPSLLAGSEDGSIRRWGLDGTSSVLGQMRGQVHAVAVAPDGRTAVAGDDQGTLLVIELASGHAWALEDAVAQGRGFLSIVAGEGDARLNAIGVRRDGEVCAISIGPSTTNVEVVGRVASGVPISVAAISRDLRRVAIGNRAGNVTTYRLDAGRLVQDGRDQLHHADWVTALAWSPDASSLLSGGWDRVVWLRREDTPPLALRGHNDTVRVCCFDPSGATCVTGSWDGTVHCWRESDGALESTATVEGRPVAVAATRTGGRTFVATGNADTTVTVVELCDGSSQWAA